MAEMSLNPGLAWNLKPGTKCHQIPTEPCSLEKRGPRKSQDVGLNSHDLCSLSFPPQKEQSCPRSATKSDLLGLTG